MHREPVCFGVNAVQAYSFLQHYLFLFYARGSFCSLHLFGFYCLKKVARRLFSTEQALGFARLLSDARGETLVNVCKQHAIL